MDQEKKTGPELLERAVKSHRDGRLAEAELLYLRTIESGFHHEIAFSNLGVIYKNTNRSKKAIEIYKRAILLNPQFPDVHANLGNLFKELGQLDQALTSLLMALELKPDHPYAHLSLGGIYKDLGQLDQAITCLNEAMKSEKTKEQAAIALAETYYCIGYYRDGVRAISEINSKGAKNLLLSLYLCLDEKLEFNRCADDLIGKRWLNPQGIAAIDHANILYRQTLDNGLDGTSIDSVFVQTIDEQEFPDTLIERLLIRLLSGSLQSRDQGHLIKGLQTSGNILDLPEEPFQSLKKLLVRKIDNYNQLCNIYTDKNFKTNWEKGMYVLRGWAIIMDKGGNLTSHNHELGWLTGTFYLQMPEEGANREEGAIEFSLQGPKYPEGNSSFERRVIRPKARDLNIFSSSLFHRTLPFQSETQRICIAFDVTRKEKP